MKSTSAAPDVGHSLMYMARTNPTYQGPGAVFDNPLYEPGLTPVSASALSPGGLAARNT